MEKIKPMLAETGNKNDLKKENFIFELKIDGTRCICFKSSNEIKFLNRRGIWFENRYPEIVADLIKNIRDNVILDGEIYVPDRNGNPDIYKLAERDHLDDKLRIEIISKQMPATYAIFDILSSNGKDLTKLPLIERKKILKKTVKDSDRVKKIYYTDKGEELWKVVKKMKLEGVMAKDKSSSYLIGKRSNLWLKIKTLKTLDLVIAGYSTGTGKRREIGSLITACYYKGKLIYTGKIGTGLTEECWKNILQTLEKIKSDNCPFEMKPELDLPSDRKPVWVKQKYVCEAKFMNLSKDLVMRAPVFMRLRDDKEPKDCNLEGDLTDPL